MKTTLRIDLLGELQVVRGDRVTARMAGVRAGSLLAYLARDPGKGHPREALIDLLWPDLDLDAGRDNLSKTLGQIRRAVNGDGGSESILVADRRMVRLDPEMVTTDLMEFERLVGEAGRTDDPDRRIERLSQAAGLYRGEFLAGSYDEWALAE